MLNEESVSRPIRGRFARLLLGAWLGGLFGLVVGWALAGGWDWIYLSGIPIHLDIGSSLLASLLAGIIGSVAGLVISWPARWENSIFPAGCLILLASLPLVLDFDTVSSLRLWILLPILGVSLCVVALSLLMRALIGAISFYAAPGSITAILYGGLAMLVISLGLTRVPDYLLDYAQQRRQSFKLAYAKARQSGKQVDHMERVACPTRDIDMRFISRTCLKIRMADGSELICEVVWDREPSCRER